MIDMTYHFKGFLGSRCRCRIRIINTPGKDVIIATEPKDGRGDSVARCAPQMATRIAHEFRIDPERLVWIEHHPKKTVNDSIEEERFDLVRLSWNGKSFLNTERKPIGRDELEQMIFMEWRPESYDTIH